LGHLMESKGVFVAIEAVGLANAELRKSGAAWRAHLTLAGSFASEEERVRAQEAMENANEVAGGEWLVASGDGEGGMGAGGSVFRSFGVSGVAGVRAQRSEGSGAMIELVGFLDSGQKKSALERADCLVFPTFYEGETQGLVLLEAMSAGLPVITTSWRGVAEVLPEGGLSPVAPKLPAELAERIQELPAYYPRADFRSHFEAFFTAEKHSAKLLNELLPEDL